MSASYLVVDPDLELAPYQQIVEQVRSAIERGELTPESPLPTVRQLAGDLGVAPNTVARAYTDLQSEGWLVGEGRRGTRVADRTPSADGRARTQSLHASIVAFFEGLRYRGFTRAEIDREIGRVLEEAPPPA